MFNWFIKEQPIKGLTGFGGGLFQSRFSSSPGEYQLQIYAWGAGATTRSPVIKGGFSQALITLPASVRSTYTRLEVIVGQGSAASSRTFGGGGAADTPGTAGGGFAGVFLSAPGLSTVLTAPGTALNIPVANADARCLIIAGGAGGKDGIDGSGGGGGGGLTAPTVPGLPGTAPTVNRSGGGSAYMGANGGPGPTWAAGGGGGGYEGGFANNDWDAWGGCGYVGHTNPSQPQPFSGPSPVNPNLDYTDGFTLGNNPGPPYVSYSNPAPSAPYYPGTAGTQNQPGSVTIISPTTTTTFGYTGTIQYFTL